MMKDAKEDYSVIINHHQAALSRKYDEYQKYYQGNDNTVPQHQLNRPRRHASRRKRPTTNTGAGKEPSETAENRCQSEPVVLPPIAPTAHHETGHIYYKNTPVRLKILNNLHTDNKFVKSQRSLPSNKSYQNKHSLPVSHESLLWNSSQIYERLRKRKWRTPVDQETSDFRNEDASKVFLRRTDVSRSFRYKKESESKRKDDDLNKEVTQILNIREKIEQFRDWHEREYKNKLELSKQNDSKNKKDAEHLPAIESNDKGKLRLTSANDKDDPSFEAVQHKGNLKLPLSVKQVDENQDSLKDNPLLTDELQTKSTRERFRQDKFREASVISWKTWRDVNDSYAYDNVESYIRDNDLLSKEKVNWIHCWLDQALKIREKGLENDVDSDSTATEDAEDLSLFP